MAVSAVTLRSVLADELRLLTFRPQSEGAAQRWRAYLAFGLACAWLAGIGRYWDNPRAHLWQHRGFGSVVYVFCLALIIWLLVLPLGPLNWSYRSVLVFISLASPPALLYAIPVERFTSLETAQSLNAWFLAAVAAWRVALLVVFLRRVAGLTRFATLVAALLPLVAIVAALTALNLEHVVFSIMSGIRPEQRSANDTSYAVVVAITYLSLLLAPFLVVAYAVLAYRARPIRKSSQRREGR